LAYVMYTSGSTGNPKAVSIMRRNIANLARHLWFQSAFQLSAGDVFLFQCSISFDPVMENWLWPLYTGCNSYVVPGSEDRDLKALVVHVSRAHVVDFTPSAFAVIPSNAMRNLKLVIFGGETLT